ncbi:N-formylglutamate amidohydrolase [uncultured Paracoccus sp.]|uniref:N-formylglutamate amidohydrolase n=1 Tax=uncultured Paracoccus sp. TaxID=189685 RepID=UPI002617D222|nr:N-formylglutamate amidohydrolase [uncultured Paracoccus sp.]
MSRDFARLFDLVRPAQWRGGLIFASPHSGRDYPDWFLAESQLELRVLRSSEDAFVDRLIEPAVAQGAVVLSARVPRSVVDLNRADDEIDPRVVEGGVPGRTSTRVMSGLGVVPRVVGQGREIRRLPLSRAEAARRITAFWHPYHAVLAGLMNEAVARFGRAVLIDVHSMPRAALSHLPGQRPELVLGDRNGVSAEPAVSAAVAAAAVGAGFRIRANSPFAGAHVVTAYGRPSARRHAVQIEIDRTLYMDEEAIVPHHGFDRFAARFAGLIARLPPALSAIDAGTAADRDRPDLAAE